jgi:transcriptional regulator with XRE-family HTH domain
MADLLEIGERIRRLRKEAGMTRERLAALSGVSRSRIEALENERAPEMGYSAIHQLLRALGQDLAVVTFNRRRPTLDDLQRENEVLRTKIEMNR